MPSSQCCSTVAHHGGQRVVHSASGCRLDSVATPGANNNQGVAIARRAQRGTSNNRIASLVVVVDGQHGRQLDWNGALPLKIVKPFDPDC